LSQTETALTANQASVETALKRIVTYLKATTYSRCLIFVEEAWQAKIARAVKAKLKRKMKVTIMETNGEDNQLLSNAIKALK
jgi:hypothetical protein